MSAQAPSPWNAPKAPLVSQADDDAPLYAGFWRRWAAAFLDGLIYYAVALAIGLTVGQGVAATLLTLAAAWLYHAGMQSSSRQATFGKMALGIKVSSLQGERISFLRATGRYFATILSSLLLMIGYLMAAFTQRKQALHDMIAGTLVVRADASPEAVQTGGGTMKVTAGVVVFGVLLAFIPVLGILAAIAIPAYSDYTVRSKITESVAVGGAARTSVTEFFTSNKRLPVSLQEAGVSTNPTQYVARVEGQFGGGKAVIRVYSSVPQANGGAVVFSAPAKQPLDWTCSSQGIPHKYLPANCRN